MSDPIESQRRKLEALAGAVGIGGITSQSTAQQQALAKDFTYLKAKPIERIASALERIATALEKL